ncbi:PREDICTED: glutathione S-transferase 1-like [Nicrophorus vespilloides]|uniref:Glutathione S-transferase 1-like n=1 Tax=Nicrophorus vespilloides TaxID=110193 RepID=A0ABM1N6V4_NICVS|nr:PREDICTED: glutathione S-transferase 1-like [Nicrophorus vespilloides]
MAPLLYKKDMSAPCRAVLLTAQAIDLELDFKDVDMLNKEHLEEDFIKLNPQHAVPVLDDEGFILCESHAIIVYLVSKYAGDDSLYPEDLQLRSQINHKLHFDGGVLQNLMRQIIGLFIFEGASSIPEKIVDSVIESYSFLEAFLQDKEWFVGDSVTLADLSLIPSVTTLNVLVPIDGDACPKLLEWISRAEELPYYSANSAGHEELVIFVKNILGA